MSDIKSVSRMEDINVPTTDLHHTDTEFSDIEEDDTSSGLESFDEDDMYELDNEDDIICDGTDTEETDEEAEALDRSLSMLERRMAESRSLYTNFENISTLARALNDIQNRTCASVHDSRSDHGSGAFSVLRRSGILEVEGRRSDDEIGLEGTAIGGFSKS
ncbi:hypothetical protein EDB84DRAFT_1564752 [Lactarius hengduanensis]|nr:hypothetical protein EDB84DRAFT_1571319 [Lactarius hengduanensis]KAH9023367.1 hypothetical protein EDB84DRAFT_1564752 [Lactarius hengduanensis]